MNRTMLMIACLMTLGVACTTYAVELLDACFRPDVAFSNHVQFWDNVKADAGAEGGFVHVFVRNDAESAVTFEDAFLEGVSLKQAIAFSEQRKFRKHAFAASIYFSALAGDQKDKLIAAGEPVWFRFDPPTIAPGECGELTVRLRSKPLETVKVSLSFSKVHNLEVVVSGKTTPPRFEGITFSFGRDKAFLYVAASASGKAPTRVLMDGKDITGDSKIVPEPAGSVYPIVCKFKSAPARGSFHCFEVVYPDGVKSTAAVRAWDDDFSYGMWGAAPSKSEDNALAEAYLRDLADHSVNTVMEQIGSEAVRSYMLTEQGRKLMDSLGIRRMVSEIGKGGTKNPWAYFLMDEPDAGDAKVEGIPAGRQVGALGQGLVERSQHLREQDPLTPHLLNVDMTYKPQNWYTYAQLADILTADPYYQIRLAETYWNKPEKRSLYEKAHFVAAVAELCRSAQAPKPLNLVIFTGRPTREEKTFRFATPQEKRIEAYYAVGAGCKGVSYWWFHSLAEGLPPKKMDPLAAAQWREIGLIGAELGTLGPLIVTSCPADIPVKTAAKLWVRTLLRGDDTLILIVINDDYVNDSEGTKITPVDRPKIVLGLPAWLRPADVFEVSAEGLSDASRSCVFSDGELTLDLGTVNVTRAIVITRDLDLRQRLWKLYDAKFAAKVTKLTARE